MATKARFSPRSGTSVDRLPRRSLSRSASPHAPPGQGEKDFFGKLLALGVVLVDVFQTSASGESCSVKRSDFPASNLPPRIVKR